MGREAKGRACFRARARCWWRGWRWRSAVAMRVCDVGAVVGWCAAAGTYIAIGNIKGGAGRFFLLVSVLDVATKHGDVRQRGGTREARRRIPRIR